MSNGAAVAAKHYRQMTDADYEQANGMAAQQATAEAGSEPQVTQSAERKPPAFPGLAKLRDSVHPFTVGDTRLELVTPSLSSKRVANASGERQELMNTPNTACTTACTSDAKIDQNPTLEAIVAALLGLSPQDRLKLATMLAGSSPNDTER